MSTRKSSVMSRLGKERARRLGLQANPDVTHMHPGCQIVQPPCGLAAKIRVQSICDGSDDGIAHGVVGEYWFCGQHSCLSCHDSFVTVCSAHGDDNVEKRWEERTTKGHKDHILDLAVTDTAISSCVERTCGDDDCDACARKWEAMAQVYMTANGESLPSWEVACATYHSVPGGGPMTVFVVRQA